MFHILSDTCVWLDLPKDHRNSTLLHVLLELIDLREVHILLPRIVLEEFARNKPRVIQDSSRSVSGNFKIVKEVVEKFASPDKKKLALEILNDVDHRIPTLGESVLETCEIIDRIFEKAEVIETTEAVQLRAVERALQSKGPFHVGSNNMADAILIEIYANQVKRKEYRGHRFAFVTHNHKHFSEPKGNHNNPHPDFAPIFSKIKSLYFRNLGEAVKRVRPELVEELIFEREGWQEPVRSLSEILGFVDEFCDKVWYNRHKNLEWKIEKGKVKIVEKETFPPPKKGERPIQADIWRGALEAARRKEAKYGLENLGPWTDFEWGMLNGKLSALRWVLGDEWDMLDT